MSSLFGSDKSDNYRTSTRSTYITNHASCTPHVKCPYWYTGWGQRCGHSAIPESPTARSATVTVAGPPPTTWGTTCGQRWTSPAQLWTSGRLRCTTAPEPGGQPAVVHRSSPERTTVITRSSTGHARRDLHERSFSTGSTGAMTNPELSIPMNDPPTVPDPALRSGPLTSTLLTFDPADRHRRCLPRPPRPRPAFDSARPASERAFVPALHQDQRARPSWSGVPAAHRRRAAAGATPSGSRRPPDSRTVVPCIRVEEPPFDSDRPRHRFPVRGDRTGPGRPTRSVAGTTRHHRTWYRRRPQRPGERPGERLSERHVAIERWVRREVPGGA